MSSANITDEDDVAAQDNIREEYRQKHAKHGNGPSISNVFKQRDFQRKCEAQKNETAGVTGKAKEECRMPKGSKIQVKLKSSYLNGGEKMHKGKGMWEQERKN